MTLKTRGALSLLAVAMLLAATAAAAQATPKFEAGSYPATVQGESPEVVIGTEGGVVQCPVSFEGTLSGAASSIDLTPFISFANCAAWGFINMTVNNVGCIERFEATEKQSTDEFLARLDFCPSGGSLTLTAGTCAIKIESAENLASLDLDNYTVAPKRVAATFEVAGLAYTVTKDGFLCPFGGTGSKTGGTVTSEPFALKAVNPSETSEELGLFLSGE